jgi:hypothetical protein
MRGLQPVASSSPRCERSVSSRGSPFRNKPLAACHDHPRSILAHGLFWRQEQEVFRPPRPHSKFTREDLKRIKEKGPTLADVTVSVSIEDNPKQAQPRQYTFVPPSVLGDNYEKQTPEPDWKSMPEMPLNLFIHGLKERNWTSVHYNPASLKWHIEMWRDTGRFMMLCFPGYRAVVTHEDGHKSWVNINIPGLPTFLEDHIAGASLGGIYKYAQPLLQPNVCCASLMTVRQNGSVLLLTHAILTTPPATRAGCSQASSGHVPASKMPHSFLLRTRQDGGIDGCAMACRWPHEAIYTGLPSEQGYNQVFEELFEAYEERIPRTVREQLVKSNSFSLPRNRLGMNQDYDKFNPASKHLALEWKCVPPVLGVFPLQKRKTSSTPDRAVLCLLVTLERRCNSVNPTVHLIRFNRNLLPSECVLPGSGWCHSKFRCTAFM